jgi:hypothetical protein
MEHENLIFKVGKCKNEGRKEMGKSPCFNDTLIDEFIYDIEVSTFVYQEFTDNDEFDKKPVFKVSEP